MIGLPPASPAPLRPRAALAVGASITEPLGAEPLSAAAPALAPGTRCGRFVVGERLGAGGMGAVYAGHDPDLDREIAIKVLHGELAGSPLADARLTREAQALARIDHPNVVAVYEVGRVGDRTYLAMARVRGETLRQWLRRPRPWRAIVALLVQVGHGLSAAHRAGLIHGDVKPDNLLVEDDARARIVDFGVAHLGADDRLAGAAAWAGTVGYAAPEQRAGLDLDARADQYGLCATLAEALTGAPTSAPRTGPRRGPRRVWRVIDRGLAADRAQRHASMDALVAALTRAAARPRRARMAGLVALAGVALAVTVAATGADAPTARGGAALMAPAPRCRDADSRVARAWHPERQAALAAQFAASGGGATWRRIAPTLDRYVTRLGDLHQAACLAGPPVTRADPVAACLDRRRDELLALLAVFADVTAGELADAARATATLGDLDRCLHARWLDGRRPAGSLPGWLLHVAIRDLLAQARALEQTGRVHDSVARASAAATIAHAQPDRRLLAEALYRRALAISRLTPMAAEADLADAAALAVGSGDDLLAAQAWTQRAWIVSGQPGRAADARELIGHSSAWIDRLAPDDPARARLLNQRGGARSRIGDHAGAVADLRAALRLAGAAQPPADATIAAAANNLAMEHRQRGAFDDAEHLLAQALSAGARAWGPQHPDLLDVVSNRGLVLFHLGRLDEALATSRAALAVKEEIYGADHARLAPTLQTIGLIQHQRGELTAAAATLRRATRLAGTDGRTLVDAAGMQALGEVLSELGETRAAQAALAQSLAVRQAAAAAEPGLIADSLHALGDHLLRNRRVVAALGCYQRELALRERAAGRTHATLVRPLVGGAQALLEAGRARAAEPWLRRALAITPRTPTDDAWARFLLSRARMAIGDRAGALTLAATARTWAVAHDAAMTEEIERWMSRYRRSGPTRSR